LDSGTTATAHPISNEAATSTVSESPTTRGSSNRQLRTSLGRSDGQSGAALVAKRRCHSVYAPIGQVVLTRPQPHLSSTNAPSNLRRRRHNTSCSEGELTRPSPSRYALPFNPARLTEPQSDYGKSSHQMTPGPCLSDVSPQLQSRRG
jgi:hypothetical protein